MIRAGDGQHAQPEPFGFPDSGGVVVAGQQLGPGEQFGGELDELEPDLVLGERLQRQVAQPGVLEAADAVFGAGAQPVADFQVGESPTAGVGGEQVIRQPSWSVMRSWAPGWGRSRRAMIRIPGGQPVKVAGSQRVSSATWAPSRGWPSASSARRQACSGSAASASRTGWRP